MPLSFLCLQVICGDFNADVYTDEETEVTQWFREKAFHRAATGLSWAGRGSVRCLDHIMHRLVLDGEAGSGSGAADVVCCQPGDGDDSVLYTAARVSDGV